MVNVSKMLCGKWLPNILSYEVPSFNYAIFGHDFQAFFFFFSGLERYFFFSGFLLNQRVCSFENLIQIYSLGKFHEFPFLSSQPNSVLFIRVRFLTFSLTNSNCVKTKCHLECSRGSKEQKCPKILFALWLFYSLSCPELNFVSWIPDPTCYLNALGRVTARAWAASYPILSDFCWPAPDWYHQCSTVRPQFESWPRCPLCDLQSVTQPSPDFTYESFSWG